MLAQLALRPDGPGPQAAMAHRDTSVSGVLRGVGASRHGFSLSEYRGMIGVVGVGCDRAQHLDVTDGIEPEALRDARLHQCNDQ